MRLHKSISHLAFLAVIGATFVSCSDDLDEKIRFEELPREAQLFVENHYKGVKVTSTHRDGKSKYADFDVRLSNGTEIEFDHLGVWKDVDAAPRDVIPSGIAPSNVENYVNSAYPGDGINEISRVAVGYEVELVSGLDLVFGSDGAFFGIDR